MSNPVHTERSDGCAGISNRPIPSAVWKTVHREYANHVQPSRQFFCKRDLNDLFEYQLREVIETILPDYEVVLSVRIVDECARYALLIAESLELHAIEKQSVSSTAYHPQELVLFLHLIHIRNELLGAHRVWRRREATHVGKHIHVTEAEIERLTATHG